MCRQGGPTVLRSPAIAVQLTVLGSGSKGNATLLANRDARVLIDLGLSYRDVVRRLEYVGVDPNSIEAIIITHAHGDHTRGARVFSQRHAVPVYTTAGVRHEWGVPDLSAWRPLTPNRSLPLCGLQFHPFEIPHDASEAVGFRIETLEGSIGFATDVGVVTAEMVERFRDCSVLVVESNHAIELLRVSPYDPSTRVRITSPHGHLSNESLAVFIRSQMGAAVRCIVLAHLSQVNNVPQLAELTCREALADCGRDDVEVIVACQDQVARTVDLGSWSPRQRRAALSQAELPFDRRPPTVDCQPTTS